MAAIGPNAGTADLSATKLKRGDSGDGGVDPPAAKRRTTRNGRPAASAPVHAVPSTLPGMVPHLHAGGFATELYDAVTHGNLTISATRLSTIAQSWPHIPADRLPIIKRVALEIDAVQQVTLVCNILERLDSIETFSLVNVAPPSDESLHAVPAASLATVLLQQTSLAELRISGVQFDSDTVVPCVDAIAQSSSLTALELSRCNLGPSTVMPLSKAIRNCVNLSNVNLKGTDMDVDCFHQLSSSLMHLPSLTTLNLENNRLVSKPPKYLAFPKRLERLSLTGNEVADCDKVFLKSCFERLPVLRELSLQCHSAHALPSLMRAVAVLKGLTSWTLLYSGGPITDEAADSLAFGIQSLPNLACLYMSHLELNTDGWLRVGDAFQACTQLAHLTLSHCPSLSNHLNMRLLAEHCLSMSKLQHLSMTHCKLGSGKAVDAHACADHVGRIISQSRTLKSIDLTGNEIQDKAVSPILWAMLCNLRGICVTGVALHQGVINLPIIVPELAAAHSDVTVLQYYRKLVDAESGNRLWPLIVLGAAGAGKSSLIARLRGVPQDAVPLSHNRIQVSELLLSQLGMPTVNFTVYDMSGPAAMHHLFFNPRAVYVIVWSRYDLAAVRHLVSMVRRLAPDAAVVAVETVDMEVPTTRAGAAFDVRELQIPLCDTFKVAKLGPCDLAPLRTALLQKVNTQEHSGGLTSHHTAVLHTFQQLRRESAACPAVLFHDLVQLLEDRCGIPELSVRGAVQHFHDRGVVFWMAAGGKSQATTSAVCDKVIFVDMQYIVDCLTAVLNPSEDTHSLIPDGRLLLRHMNRLWNDPTPIACHALQTILYRTMLAHPLVSNNEDADNSGSLVPSLLSCRTGALLTGYGYETRFQFPPGVLDVVFPTILVRTIGWASEGYVCHRDAIGLVHGDVRAEVIWVKHLNQVLVRCAGEWPWYVSQALCGCVRMGLDIASLILPDPSRQELDTRHVLPPDVRVTRSPHTCVVSSVTETYTCLCAHKTIQERQLKQYQEEMVTTLTCPECCFVFRVPYMSVGPHLSSSSSKSLLQVDELLERPTATKCAQAWQLLATSWRAVHVDAHAEEQPVSLLLPAAIITPEANPDEWVLLPVCDAWPAVHGIRPACRTVPPEQLPAVIGTFGDMWRRMYRLLACAGRFAVDRDVHLSDAALKHVATKLQLMRATTIAPAFGQVTPRTSFPALNIGRNCHLFQVQLPNAARVSWQCREHAAKYKPSDVRLPWSCEYSAKCRQWLINELRSNASDLSALGDWCFCNTCCSHGSGWCRLGLAYPPARAGESVASWSRAFHGIKPTNLHLIASTGLRAPGAISYHGVLQAVHTLQPESARHPVTKEFPIFLSPSMRYSSLYCQNHALPDGRLLFTVLETRVRPGQSSQVLRVHGETLGATARGVVIDPSIPNEELELWAYSPDTVVPVAVWMFVGDAHPFASLLAEMTT